MKTPSRYLVLAAGIAVAIAATMALGHPAHAEETVAPALASATPQFVVAIDAGHQAKADMRLEPIGPKSSRKRPRVEGGATGRVTHRPESLDNLQVAQLLKTELEKRGVKVVMIRTTQNVDIANSRRALNASAAHANLFVRLHCDSSTNHSVNGVLTLVPAKNVWTQRFYGASARAGRDLQAAVCAATHARNRGIVCRGDLSGFNWSRVPVALVEMGVMSNATEDRRLASHWYQHRLATGLANGIVQYLHGK